MFPKKFNSVFEGRRFGSLVDVAKTFKAGGGGRRSSVETNNYDGERRRV